jgi:antitoxin (DNA-binding transcriptional repressor) of toxin-antitoxin stability system
MVAFIPLVCHITYRRHGKILGVAEANHRFSEFIDRVGEAERFLVARHGKLAVALVPPSEQPMRAATERPVGLGAVAGALADWDDIDEVVRDIYAARRRSRERAIPSLD